MKDFDNLMKWKLGLAWAQIIAGFVFGISILLFLLFSCAAQAQENLNLIRVSWAPGPEPDIAGYRCYIGRTSGDYGSGLNAGVSPDISKEITSFSWNRDNFDQPDATHYFAVTAFDSAGNESDFSEEVFWPPDLVPVPEDTTRPGAPTVITIDGPIPDGFELHIRNK